jgi:ribosomal protein S18 acetylase RimI-like enzyme
MRKDKKIKSFNVYLEGINIKYDIKNDEYDDEKFHFYVDDINVGYIYICLYESNEIYLSSFTIFDKYQNKGLGKIFLKKILDFIKSEYSEENIKLSVGYNNEIAINMYKNFGFKEDKQNNKYEFYMIKKNK